MAIMIPEKPIDIPIGSHEDEMFIALSKLPDEYYVFHSFVIINNVNGVQYESETDFIVFNPQKGIICPVGNRPVRWDRHNNQEFIDRKSSRVAV